MKYNYSESNLEFDKLVSVMKADNSMKIKINAYTDNIDSVEYNKKLSLKRAESRAPLYTTTLYSKVLDQTE